MNVIELNRPAELRKPGFQVADDAGGFALTWVPQGVLWAEVKPGTGNDAAGIEVGLLSKMAFSHHRSGCLRSDRPRGRRRISGSRMGRGCSISSP